MMKKHSMIFVVVLALSGCSAEGVRLPLPGGSPGTSQIRAFDARQAVRASTSPSPASPSSQPASSGVSRSGEAARSTGEHLGKAAVEALFADQHANRLIIVGNVGPMRSLDAAALEQRYRLYARNARTLNGRVQLSERGYRRLSAGFCSVVYFSLPGIVNLHAYAEVPRALAGRIRFPSLLAMMTLGLTGDLVAAETDDDGWLFVRRVLCRNDDPGYARCAAHYVRGRFEAVDGREVGLDLRLKRHGARIDVVTFRRLGPQS